MVSKILWFEKIDFVSASKRFPERDFRLVDAFYFRRVVGNGMLIVIFHDFTASGEKIANGDLPRVWKAYILFSNR